MASLPALANVGLDFCFYSSGILVVFVWNYAAGSLFVWNTP